MSLSAASIRPLVDLGSSLNRKRRRRAIQFIVGPALLIALWWVAYAGTLVDPHLLPSPFATLADTWKNIASGAMTRDVLQTLLRVSYAFAIAAALGVPVGSCWEPTKTFIVRSNS
jgi:ABC-type nitrate/sulfonate/bicarbonate transport system permease component